MIAANVLLTLVGESPMDKTYNTTLQILTVPKGKLPLQRKVELQELPPAAQKLPQKRCFKAKQTLKAAGTYEMVQQSTGLAALAQNISSYTKSRETCTVQRFAAARQAPAGSAQRAAAEKHD
jgi:hypothetical protein